MSIRNIRWPEERDAIAEHIRLVHGAGDLDFLMQWYGMFPRFDPADCFVIEGDAGEIAAHAMLIPRMLRIGAALVPVAEIGVVGTLEPYRGRGYASALLDRVVARMTERGDALGLILGIPNFYEQWGFEYAAGLYLTSYESTIDLNHAFEAGRWDRTHSYQRRASAYLGLTGQEVVVRRFYDSDLPAVMLLYDQESAQGHYLIGRDQTAWLWQLGFLTDIGRYDPDDFLVAERNGEITGYIRLVSHGQVNWFLEHEAARFSIIEAGGSDPDSMEALLGAAALAAHDYNVERLGLYVHPRSRLMQHVLAHGGTQRAFTGAAFMRAHDLRALLTALRPAFEARLADSYLAGTGCVLHIQVEDDAASVTVGEGGAEVRLDVPRTDLVRLVTGWFGIDDLPPAYYSQQHANLLRVLFPKRDPRIGMADIL